jgi:hypothetical protein
MPAEALRTVRKRMERGWSRGRKCSRRDGAGRADLSEQAEARSLPAAFALAATDGIPVNHVPAALRALADVTEAPSFRAWNDSPDRTQQQVLDALDAPIARIEGDRQ